MGNTLTMATLRKSPDRVVAHAKRSGRPIVITEDGTPQCVVISPRAYEKQLKALSLAKLLAESEADFRAGRFRLARNVIRDLRRDYGL